MRKRDLAILLLSAFAIFFSLQHEGNFSFKEAWFHLSDDYPIKYEGERLPPPIVADLNGDGRSEVFVATHDAKIQVLAPHLRRVDEGFSEVRLLAEISLLPDNVRVASGRRAVAMATGFVDRTYKRGEVRKQVLVVVTSGWWVLCFDHNLKKLWQTNLQEDFPHGAHHREISISISNYTLKHGDAGLIIVGGRMEMQPHIFMDPFEEIGLAEKNAEEHRRSAKEKEAAENSTTVDLRHFAFYAFAGRTGALRWNRKNENIETHLSDATQLIPQHNYKLDVHALNSRHPGEFECREFRESLLGVMPHHWDRREDTTFKLAHFRRHKRKPLKKTPGKTANYPFHVPEENHPPGKDSTNKIPRLIGKATNYAGSAKGKKSLPYIPTITNHTKLWWVPNVIVAHQKEGIEALHLATGRTICKLHLQEHGLHADINGDGVLDHVQVVGGNGAERTVVSGSMEVLRPCWAVATSGVPVREQLFNASICHHSPFNLFQHGEYSRSFARTFDSTSLEVVTPIIIPTKDGHRHRKGSHGDVVFLTNRGEVSGLTARGLHSLYLMLVRLGLRLTNPIKATVGCSKESDEEDSEEDESEGEEEVALTNQIGDLTAAFVMTQETMGMMQKAMAEIQLVNRSLFGGVIEKLQTLETPPLKIVKHVNYGRGIVPGFIKDTMAMPSMGRGRGREEPIGVGEFGGCRLFPFMDCPLGVNHVKSPATTISYDVDRMERPAGSGDEGQRKGGSDCFAGAGTRASRGNSRGSWGRDIGDNIVPPHEGIAHGYGKHRGQIRNMRIVATAEDVPPDVLCSWLLTTTLKFMTNFFKVGVTSYSPSLHGHDAVWQWQLYTGATWSNLPSPSGMMEAGVVVPTFKPFSLRLHDNQLMILAGGDQEAVVISPGGSILTTLDLPAPPTHAIICEDFSNDGLTDLILITSSGVYGFVQTRQPGAIFFSTLIGCLIVVMGVIFISQHLNSMKGKPRASTGYR
ncbi:hypothetical protein GIB67_026680 [Kingdonia uniflora]|uniref:FG-GAP repeat-containing protein n=1 Tax=Kingdonia uniflora TaxID=39325 RepID=A0A7J7MGL6_9MAGN|nr:hypothetical protein GIB67_026680 [Kingdonia uniflora]